MIKDYGSFAPLLADDVQEAANRVINNYSPSGIGSHKREDGITNGFLQEIDSHVPSNPDIPSEFHVRTDRATVSQEREIGADFAILYDLSGSEYTLQTAILVQAKRQESSYYKNFSKLIEQCEHMLSLTTDSFVFDYSTKGMFAVPAVSVAGTDQSAFDKETVLTKKFHYKSPKTLFNELFMGYLGNEHTYRSITDSTGYGTNFRRPNFPVTDGGEDEYSIDGNETIEVLTISVAFE